MEDDVRDDQVEIEFIDEDEPLDQDAGPAPTSHAGPVEATGEDAAKLREELGVLREQYLRKLADFENYRKRQDREMADFRRHANADLVRDLLSVVDNLERAVEAAGEQGDAVRTGVEMVVRQLKDLLARHGVKEVDPGGDPFDPALHEAIQRQESPDVQENTVIQVLQKGYTLHERLLRPAMVVVAVPADGGSGPQVG